MIVKLDRKYYSYNFACWLRRYMRVEIMAALCNYSTYYMNKYLESKYPDEGISVEHIIAQCSNSLCVEVNKDCFQISINTTDKYKDISLAALANTVTFGALGVRGIPILSKVFNRVSNNISAYYTRYNPMFMIKEISDVN